MSEAPAWIASIRIFCRKRTTGASSTSLVSAAAGSSVATSKSNESSTRSLSFSVALWPGFSTSRVSLSCSTMIGSTLAWAEKRIRSRRRKSVGSDSASESLPPRLPSGTTRTSVASLRSSASPGSDDTSIAERSSSGCPNTSAANLASWCACMWPLPISSSMNAMPPASALRWIAVAWSSRSSWCWTSARPSPASDVGSAARGGWIAAAMEPVWVRFFRLLDRALCAMMPPSTWHARRPRRRRRTSGNGCRRTAAAVARRCDARCLERALVRVGGVRQRLRGQAPQPHHADQAVLDLLDLDHQRPEADADARLGQLAQRFEQQAVERARAVEREAGAEPAVQLAQRRAAVDRGLVVGPLQRGVPARRGGRELADDLFDDVFERHQPEDLPVFVDDQRDALAVLLEELQLPEYRRAARDEIRVGEDGPQVAGVERFVLQQPERAPNVQHADDAVDLALEHRQLVVEAGRQLLADASRVGCQVECLDAVARHHHVVDGDLLEVQQVQQDRAVLRRHEPAALQHDRAQLLERHAGRELPLRLDAGHPDQAPHDQVDRPHHRREHAHQHVQRIAGRQRDVLREGGADHLRRDLAEHD